MDLFEQHKFRENDNKFIQQTMNKQNNSNHYYGKSANMQKNKLLERDREVSYRGYYMENPQKQSTHSKISQKFKVKSPPFAQGKQKGEWNIDQSPSSRSFLRHTTYLAKGQSFLDPQKQSLSNSYVGKIRKDSWDIENQRVKTCYSSGYDQNYKSPLNMYGDEKYDRLASKVKETANFIQQLKKFKGGYKKGDDKISSDLAETLPTNKSSKTYMDLNFKKKQSKNQFYTPKPESNPINNCQKFKRIFSPQVQFKAISPSYKKFQEAVSIKDFIIDGKLGGGKFGTVNKAMHIKTKSLYAIKKIPKAIIQENMMIDQFILEFKLQSFLKHQNIVQVYGLFDDKQHLYMILEYMPDGTLYSLLKKKKTLSQKSTAFKMKQITKAIVFMHQNGIVHRDIKPENIVISGNVCKLCDFGWATICQDRRKTYCGTFDYAAPQILSGMEYDMTVDIWCLGVMCYQLMIGKAPFYHISRKETIKNILSVDTKKIVYPAHISEKARSFIDGLLKRNPEQRITYDQILDHPFLADVQDE